MSLTGVVISLVLTTFGLVELALADAVAPAFRTGNVASLRFTALDVGPATGRSQRSQSVHGERSFRDSTEKSSLMMLRKRVLDGTKTMRCSPVAALDPPDSVRLPCVSLL